MNHNGITSEPAWYYARMLQDLPPHFTRGQDVYITFDNPEHTRTRILAPASLFVSEVRRAVIPTNGASAIVELTTHRVGLNQRPGMAIRAHHSADLEAAWHQATDILP